MQTLSDSLSVAGRVSASGGFDGPVDRNNIVIDSGVAFELPLQNFRVWDAFHTNLPSVGASDDIGLATGTYGTQIPHFKSQELNALGAMTQEKARTGYTLPYNYVQYSTVKIRICAGMLSAVAATSATVTVQAFLAGRATVAPIVSGSNLVVTAATTCNSTTLSNLDFILTSSAISPGSVLDILVLFDATSATASSHFLIASHAEIIHDVRG